MSQRSNKITRKLRYKEKYAKDHKVFINRVYVKRREWGTWVITEKVFLVKQKYRCYFKEVEKIV